MDVNRENNHGFTISNGDLSRTDLNCLQIIKVIMT